LGKSIERFLEWKAENTSVTERTLEEDERHLNEACDFFEVEASVPIAAIRPHDVERWVDQLRHSVRPHDRSVGVSGNTLRNRLHSLSSFFRWAVYREFTVMNPVGALIGLAKPGAEMQEAKFLQPDSVALLLEAARIIPGVHEFQHALVATFALTGGRRTEVCGLEVQDVDFDRKTLTFRPNEWRRLKTHKSLRVIPLWPQLSVVLKKWINKNPSATLLFPLNNGGEERMLTDLRPVWRQLGAAIEWKAKHPLDPPRLSAKALRNAYAAQRLQTLDRGEPIAVYTVARELGHASTEMLERIYAHVGVERRRSKVVEFRIAHYKSITEQVKELRARQRAAGAERSAK